MLISDIIAFLETIAPLDLQESYDNAGLIVGDARRETKGVLVCLDSTPDIVVEAMNKDCNLIVAHHPIIFKGLRKLNGSDYVQQTVIAAIKNDIAIYAIHTNLDNVLHRGVNGRIAKMIGLQDCRVLSVKLANDIDDEVGAGVVGIFPDPMPEENFLAHLKSSMALEVFRHTPLLGKSVQRVAICGGSGSFLLPQAMLANADVFVTADFKYHEYFDANGKILIADIGHYESERFTIDLLCDQINENFPKFAAYSAETITNPVTYYH